MASVYETLVTHPNSTVSSLMRQTRLSRPTITTLLDSLTEMGLVAPQGAEGSVGRPAGTRRRSGRGRPEQERNPPLRGHR